MLPIDIQMQIDLAAQDAHRAIAEGFAKLRAKLPLAPIDHMARLQAALTNNVQAYMLMQDLQGVLRPSTPRMPDWGSLQNVGMVSGAYYGCLGALGGLFTGAATLPQAQNACLAHTQRR